MAKKAKSSSFSRASDFEKCPLFFKYRHIDKIEDPRPKIPGAEHPLDRGTRLHTLAENYVQTPRMKCPPELEQFKDRLDKLRILYERGWVALEERLAFDKTWNEVEYLDFENVIYRMVADVRIRPSKDKIIAIDYKTGKKDGNEVKHHDQCMEYATSYALVNQEIQEFTIQLWYFDQPLSVGNPTIKVFTREQVLANFPKMRERHTKVIDAELFPAHPSMFACRFCPYKAGLVGRGKKAYAGTGHCRRNVV